MVVLDGGLPGLIVHVLQVQLMELVQLWHGGQDEHYGGDDDHRHGGKCIDLKIIHQHMIRRKLYHTVYIFVYFIVLGAKAPLGTVAVIKLVSHQKVSE